MADLSREQVLAALKSVLQDFARRGPIAENTLILHDLDIAGDDADEFMDAVHVRFGTRFDGYDATLYFPGDEIGSAERWLRRLGFEDRHRPLTVGHLVDVILRGAWFDPPDRPVPFVKGSLLRRYAVRGLAAAGLPLLYGIMAMGFGEGIGEAIGLARGVGLALVGLPVAVLLTISMWRKLPAN